MKWYTLEERPLKEGDWGIFYVKGTEGHDETDIFVARYTKTTLKYGHVESYYYSNVKQCCHPEEYTFFEDFKGKPNIIGWIPSDELEATLPKETK